MREAVEKARSGNMTVEIVRLFAYKLNVGNYESRGFFCSQKAECRLKDAKRWRGALHTFYKTKVLKAVNQFRSVDAKKIKDATKDEGPARR
jgi:hypothetical protein